MTGDRMVVDGIAYRRPAPAPARMVVRPMFELFDDGDRHRGRRCYWRYDPDREFCEPCWLRHGVLTCWPSQHGRPR